MGLSIERTGTSPEVQSPPPPAAGEKDGHPPGKYEEFVGDTQGYIHYKRVKELLWRPIFGIACLFRSPQHFRTGAAWYDPSAETKISPDMAGAGRTVDKQVFTSDPDALKFYDSAKRTRGWKCFRGWTRGRLERRAYLGKWLVESNLTMEQRLALRRSAAGSQLFFSQLTIWGNVARVYHNIKALGMECGDDERTNPLVYSLIGTETVAASMFAVTQLAHSSASICLRMLKGGDDVKKHIRWNDMAYGCNYLGKTLSLSAQSFQIACGFQKLFIEMAYKRGEYSDPVRLSSIIDAVADIGSGIGAVCWNWVLRRDARIEYAKRVGLVTAARLGVIMSANDTLSTSMKVMPEGIVGITRVANLAPLIFPAFRSLVLIYNGITDETLPTGRRWEMIGTGATGILVCYLLGRGGWLCKSASSAVGMRLSSCGMLLMSGLSVNQQSYRNDWECYDGVQEWMPNSIRNNVKDNCSLRVN